MYTALRATSQTLAAYIRQRLEAEHNLDHFFGSSGTMVVSLNTPQEMTQPPAQQGVSVWLYRVIRDEQRLNAPPERLGPNQLRYPPLPLCLHYLVTPVIDSNGNGAGPEVEQTVLGKVLQIFHDHPRLRGTDLRDDFSGTTVELHVRLEPLTLEEITRIWEGLHSSYQLSVSYEVSVVNIASAMEPESVSPVQVALPEYGVIVSAVSP
jgi:hypothetical protein